MTYGRRVINQRRGGVIAMSQAEHSNSGNNYFKDIDYSNAKQIQWLIRFYDEFKEIASNTNNIDLVDVFIDLDTALRKANITKRQRQVLTYYIQGWTEQEIGGLMDVSQQAVHKLMRKACMKISEYLTD